MAEPRYVPVIAPDGSRMELPEENLSAAVQDGFTVDESAQYEGSGGRTFLEGVARGGTLGLSDVVQAEGAGIGTMLGDALYDATHDEVPRAAGRGIDAGLMTDEQLAEQRAATADAAIAEAKAGILGRQQTNTGAAVAGELVGGLGLGIATGGLGTAGIAAKGTTTLGKAGYAALAGATEGAVFGAAKAADDDFLADREITAERILMGAGEGIVLGGVLGGGASLFGSGAKYAAGKVADKLSDAGMPGAAGYIDQLAGESAYKAAVGRTSKSAMKAADRQGGSAAIGETLLREGVELTGDAEAKLASIAAKADETGAKLGALAKEADSFGAGPSRSGLKTEIEEKVLKQLDEGTFSEGTAATVRNKLQRMLDKLSTAERPIKVRGPNGTREIVRDSMSFDEMRALRMELDDELANWNKLTAEQGPLKAYRDVRRVMEDYWLDSAEAAASKVGREGFAAEVKALKKTYSHLALARDQAQEAVTTALANRATSLTDTIAGAGAATSLGGIPGMLMGIASSQAHRYVRERGRGYLATAIYKARQAAVRGEMALDDTASKLLTSVKRGASKTADRAINAMPIGGVILSPSNPASYENTIQHLIKLQDPSSPERLALNAQHSELELESPEHAAAVKAQTQTTVDFLVSKAGQSSTDLSSPFAHLKKPKHDRAKAESLARYARAAQNPGAALKRVSDGSATREDVETVKELYPRLWARFGAKVRAQLAELKEPPDYASQLRLSRLLGQPMTPFESPAFQQAIVETDGLLATAEAAANRGLTKLAKATSNSAAGSDRTLARGE